MSSYNFPRPRGAPYGNSNAFKHGLYSNNLKKRPPSEKDTTVIKSLSDEIALIRLFTQRLIDNQAFCCLAPTGLGGDWIPLPTSPSSPISCASSASPPPPSRASCVSIS